MDVPISIGVTLATALSLFETIRSGDHAYFDGATMLLFFLLIPVCTLLTLESVRNIFGGRVLWLNRRDR